MRNPDNVEYIEITKGELKGARGYIRKYGRNNELYCTVYKDIKPLYIVITDADMKLIKRTGRNAKQGAFV